MKPTRPLSETIVILFGIDLISTVIYMDFFEMNDNIWAGLLMLIIALLCLKYVLNCVFSVFEYIVDYYNWRRKDES